MTLARALFFSLAVAFAGACDDSDGGVVVTTTTSNTEQTTPQSTTTTTGSTTTSSTLGGCPNNCSDAGVDCFCEFSTCHCAAGLVILEMEVLSDVPLGALQVQIGYGANEEFLGVGDQVECQDLTGSLSSFNDDEDAHLVTAGFVSLGGFGGSGAVPLLRCRLRLTGEPPVAADFSITVIDASDVNVAPVSPLPVVRVSSIVDVPKFP